MKLNPAKFLDSRYKPSGFCLLISAAEDYAPFAYAAIRSLNERFFNDAIKHNYVGDRYFNLDELEDILSAGSLFGDNNLFILSFKTKPTVEQQRQLSAIIPRLNSENFMILACDKLDRKELSSDWVTLFNESGDYLAIGDDDNGEDWCRDLLAKASRQIDDDALAFLLVMNQNNPAQLLQECEKLTLLFPANQLITIGECQEALVSNAQYNVFALADAYLRGELDKVLKIFPAVCSSSDEAILLMWNLGEDLRKLITIKNALRSNANFRTAIEGMRIWGNGIAAFEKANQRLSYNVLVAYFSELAEIDCVLKGIKAGDALLKLERLIINFCKGNEI